MGFFKSLFKSAANVVGNTISKIPVIGGVGDAIVSELGRQDAKDQLESEQDWSSRQAQINRDFQREERELTQQWNLEQWQREMDYNSPQNQLDLAMKAGINPNDVIGNGAGFVATNAPETSPMSGNMAGSPGSIASGLLLQDPQTANLLASARKINAEAEGKEIENSFAPVVNELAIKKAKAEIDKIGADKGFTEEQTKQMKDLFDILKGKNEEELKQLKQETLNLVEQGRALKAQADTAEYERNQAKWANDFREKYGVTPQSGLIDGIIQLIASGEKGANIAESLIETTFSVLGGAISGTFKAGKRIADFLGGSLNGYDNTYKPGESVYIQ